jgi:dipeptidase E
MKNIVSIICFILFVSSCTESGKSNKNASTSDDSHLDNNSKITLFLTSTGSPTLSGIIPLLPFKPEGKKVSYVTTASVVNGVIPQWMNTNIELIEKAGFIVDRVDISLLTHEDMEDTFSGSDLFWVGGGNTLYLLQEVRKSGFDKYVTNKIFEGVPYVGASAGSIILGPDLEFELYSSQTPELASYEGLNLFPFAPYVHFDAEWTKEIYVDILKFSLENNKSFITLRDDQFIYVTGEKWQVIDLEKKDNYE